MCLIETCGSIIEGLRRTWPTARMPWRFRLCTIMRQVGAPWPWWRPGREKGRREEEPKCCCCCCWLVWYVGLDREKEATHEPRTGSKSQKKAAPAPPRMYSCWQACWWWVWRVGELVSEGGLMMCCLLVVSKTQETHFLRLDHHDQYKLSTHT